MSTAMLLPSAAAPRGAILTSNRPQLHRAKSQRSSRGKCDGVALGCSPALGASSRSWAPSTCIRGRRNTLRTLRVLPETSQLETKRGGADGADSGESGPWQWEQSEDAARAYGVWASVILLGSVPILSEVEGFDLAYFLSMAMSTIYIGAHRNMTAKARQSVTMKEGFLAPLLASGVLFGGYLVFKLFPDLDIQTLLNGYFALVGTVAVTGNLLWPLRQWTGKDLLGAESMKMDVPEGLLIDMAGDPMNELRAAPSDLLAVAIALALTYEDISHAHMLYPVNNAIATMIVADLLGLLGLNSFRTAAVLLVGLLAYDVFWVFGSPTVVGDNVMLSMATSDHLSGPIKLLFPRSELSMFQEGGNYPFELLGLGDVALPGLLACLALRYDASRTIDIRGRAEACAKAMQDALDGMSADATGDEICDAAADAIDGAYDEIFEEEQRMREEGVTSFERVSEAVLGNRNFFWPVLAAYGLGLYIAFEANRITHLGQPALLYLVPCTLGAVAITAALRGETRRVWQFKDKGSGMTLKEAWDATAKDDIKAED